MVGFSGFLTNISDFSVFRIIPALKPGTESRLVQVGEEIQPDKSQVFTYQDVEKIVKEAGKLENNIAVVPCTCRTMSMMLKTNPDCKRTVTNCLVFGVPSRYVVEQGIGHYIDVDETLEILKQAEKEGMVHLSQNTIDRHGFICNCCDCCCENLFPVTRDKRFELMTPNRFLAVVDEELCKGCKDCVERCRFDAIEMRPGKDSKKLKASIDPEMCKGCGLCIITCEQNALTYEIVRPPEYLRPRPPESQDQPSDSVRKIPVWGHYNLK